MHTKYETPHQPNWNEEAFIYMMETHIHCDKHTLTVMCDCTERDLRFYQERYNNFKFIGNVPKGEIHIINGVYTLVKPDTPHSRKYQIKALNDLIKAKIAYKSNLRIFGKLNAKGQVNFAQLDDMGLDEIHEVAKMLEGLK